jgi:hypothetical protein
MIQLRKYPYLSPRRHFPICPICNEIVELTSSMTDDNGKAIHEDCYVEKTKGRWTTKRGRPPTAA